MEAKEILRLRILICKILVAVKTPYDFLKGFINILLRNSLTYFAFILRFLSFL